MPLFLCLFGASDVKVHSTVLGFVQFVQHVV